MDTVRKRIHWIDIAKGICIIFIVLGHSLHFSNIRTYVYSFHVPLFFFLSGYVLNIKNDGIDYVKKKVRTIVVPYFVFSLASICIFGIAGQIMPEISEIVDCNVINNIKVMLIGNSKPDVMKYNSPLWFLPCYFIGSILLFALERAWSCFNNNIKKNIARICTIIIAILFGGGSEAICLSWHIQTAIAMLLWLELGVIAKEFTPVLIRKSKKHIKVSYILIPIFLIAGYIAGAANYQYASTSLQIRLDIYGNLLLYMVSAVCGIAGWCGIAQLLHKQNILEYIGKNTMPILVMHKFPILLFQELISLSKQLLESDNWFIKHGCGTVVTGIAIILSLMVGWVINRVLPEILGNKKKDEAMLVKMLETSEY